MLRNVPLPTQCTPQTLRPAHLPAGQRRLHGPQCSFRCSSTTARDSSTHDTHSQLFVPESTGTSAAESDLVTAPSGWHPLKKLWQGNEQEAIFRQGTPYPLRPPWKVMLLSDGSVTRHLQLMTDQKVEVECLEMRNIGQLREGLPPQVALIDGPLVQRQVFLHIPDPRSKAYVYACSWWNAEEVDSFLRDRSQPIWVSLSEGRTELYREVLGVEYGTSPYLEGRFEAEGPYWGRHYLFWRNGRPLTLIYEVFSTALEELLGPMRLDE